LLKEIKFHVREDCTSFEWNFHFCMIYKIKSIRYRWWKNEWNRRKHLLSRIRKCILPWYSHLL